MAKKDAKEAMVIHRRGNPFAKSMITTNCRRTSYVERQQTSRAQKKSIFHGYQRHGSIPLQLGYIDRKDIGALSNEQKNSMKDMFEVRTFTFLMETYALYMRNTCLTGL